MRLLLLVAVFVLSMPAATHYITVAGLGGEEDFDQRFTGWAQTIDQVLRTSRTDARIETLTGANATRDRVREVLEKAARDCGPADAIALMLIGHGTFDGQDYKLALPGPDITASELATLMNRIRAGRQVVVNMTTSSGASLAALQKEGRIVITATKSGTEKNATVFPRYWAEALRDPAADTDKNEAVTALEAYRYAALKTTGFYESQKRIATEHPMLEDSGKGEGVRDPKLDEGQGRLAAAFTVLRFGEAQAAAKDPVKQKLFVRKEQVEQQIDKLKYEKAALDASQYKRDLARLLLELARLQEEIEK